MEYFWVIIAYLVILIGVGAWRSRSVKTQEDFMVAGRGLSAKVLVGTLLATWIGSGSIIAGAGLAYDRGIPALWFNLGVWVALVVLYLVAGRARAFAQFTVPDILEARYNSTARLLGTLVTIIAYTAIVSYQFRAGGMVLNLVTGISVEWGMIITAAFVIGYTILAGMLSVAYTDVVNGVIMVIGLLIALPFLLDNAGGIEGVIQALPDAHLQPLGDMTLLEALGYSLPAMLLLLGESGMYQRFFSAKDERTAKRSVVGWIIGTIFVEALIVVLAIIGSAVFTDIESEMVILHVVRFGLPLFVGCLCLAAIVAVIVSTADSFLLVPATNIMRDIYQRFINPKASQEQMVRYSRYVVLLLGLFAFAQVRFFEKVLEMAIYAYTMYGVGITPAVMAAFFWKRATASGGVSSIASGMTVTIIWELAAQPFDIPTVYPALLLSLGCLIIVSLLSKPPDRRQWEPFQEQTGVVK
ncbi:MAG: sodium:solute symporter family protein [candidate division Zixibacteria bacterium]|nr:sodium:solute symporter family protein [candidate division Zixibacteria bacterium]MDH3936258.1 sodium:solute symporter family protein [candidate division Zixibacteria bacterium]MDH4034457.1 sodium:solute symporter family protein [candidate division Zixibacteria bacterium]